MTVMAWSAMAAPAPSSPKRRSAAAVDASQDIDWRRGVSVAQIRLSDEEFAMVARKRPKIWVVVADGARARFFMPRDDARGLVAAAAADMVSPESRRPARALKSDRPGRSHSSSRSGVRHALEPPHDYHKLEKRRFSAALAQTLDGACDRKAFDSLVLVAPRRSLGELRLLMSGRVRRQIVKEVARDLTNETPASLWRHLAPAVRTALLG